MSEREVLFHHMGSKQEIFIYRNADRTLTLHTENEGSARVLRDGENPIESKVTLEDLQERFAGSSLLPKIEQAIKAAI